jgi:hypothetical protein
MKSIHNIHNRISCKLIKDCDPSNLFESTLQFNPAARGPWSIVHVGILVPESHQIFVCADGCLRGTVLSAHEGGFENRFSTVSVHENNIVDGDLEEQIIEGCSDVIKRLNYKPRAIEIFSSCLHAFSNCDEEYCNVELRKRFPDILFQDCYMTPITRNSGITPDEQMRLKMYSYLEESNDVDNSVAILGNVFSLGENSELRRCIEKSSHLYRDITLCKTFDEYEEISKSEFFIYNLPSAEKGAKLLAKRLNKPLYYSPISYRINEIKCEHIKLSKLFKVSLDTSETEIMIQSKITKLQEMLKDYSVAIDYTATYRVFNLAHFLVENGINVSTLYVEGVASEDIEDFNYLKENCPLIKLISPSSPGALFLHSSSSSNNKVLAIGQKAAYFESTDNFVNMIEGNGYQGFDGLLHLLEDMIDALITPKDTESIISVKAWGCNCG